MSQVERRARPLTDRIETLLADGRARSSIEIASRFGFLHKPERVTAALGALARAGRIERSRDGLRVTYSIPNKARGKK